MSFKKGDKVVTTKSFHFDGEYFKKGEEGTVIRYGIMGSSVIDIQWNRGFCWFIPTNLIRLEKITNWQKHMEGK